MSWIKKASDEVRFSGDAWVRVWVTSTDVESSEQIGAIKDKYKKEVERLRDADLKPSQKIDELNKIRKDIVAEAETIADDVIGDIATQKCIDLSSYSESNYGIKLEIELKRPDRGSINNWDNIFWSEDDEQAELWIDEVTE